MKKLPILVALVLLSLSLVVVAHLQNTSNSNSRSSNANKTVRRGPIFRATSDQIKQAQAVLKQKGFYAGEQTGKLDAGTRAGLKKYQQAEGLKITGTLNKVTLEKMGIVLTDQQKRM